MAQSIKEQTITFAKSRVWRERDIDNLIQRFINETKKQEEELFTFALRTVAEPPIKGKITKGKITWRGIKVIRQRDEFHYTSWLEQRGKQISPKICINYIIPT